jgi:hypothetical protein
MKFMMTFTFKTLPKARDQAIARFKKTGARPPKGATLLGRWVAADFRGGFDLVECSDAGVLTEFALQWSDLLDMQVVPVIEDDDLKAVLKRLQ